MVEFRLYCVEIFGIVDRTLFRYYVSARDKEEAKKLAVESFKCCIGGEYRLYDRVEIIELNEPRVIAVEEGA